jgi:hypothetical protein
MKQLAGSHRSPPLAHIRNQINSNLAYAVSLWVFKTLFNVILSSRHWSFKWSLLVFQLNFVCGFYLCHVYDTPHPFRFLCFHHPK